MEQHSSNPFYTDEDDTNNGFYGKGGRGWDEGEEKRNRLQDQIFASEDRQIESSRRALASLAESESMGISTAEYITMRVHPDQMMSHGGSTDPCGSVEVYSIGALGDKNPDHADKIATFIEDKLKIPKDRFYVTFVDLKREDVGLGGKTFAQIAKK